MDIVIKKLTSELLDDYLYFFDNVAFSDHKEWSLCYCMSFHMTEEMESEHEKTGEIKNRKYSIKYIKEGKQNGYLAFYDGKPIGWLNTDDRNAYVYLSHEKNADVWDDADEGVRIKSLVCFTIAPEMRGRKVATKLLERALSDAKDDGYDIAEAYPIKGEGDCYLNYLGPKKMYEKSGFEIHKDLEQIYVMRLNLK